VASSDQHIAGPVASTTTRVGRYRWRICALLFAATTLNYIDRQVLGVLAPDLSQQFGWNELQYSYIVTAFQAQNMSLANLAAFVPLV